MNQQKQEVVFVTFVTERLSDKRKTELPGPIELNPGDILYDFDGHLCKILYKKTA